MIPFAGRDTVAAVVRAMVPSVEPAGATTGVLEWLDSRADGVHAELWATLLTPGFEAISSEPAVDVNLLEALQTRDTWTGWTVSPKEFVARLADLVAEASYAPRSSPSWATIGFRPEGKVAQQAPDAEVRLPQAGLASLASRYDVIIVGAGAGGGVAAKVLSEAGAKVLIIDRGQHLLHNEVTRDHLATHRLSQYGHNTGPNPVGNPRVFERDGVQRVVARPYEGAWNNNAMTVGGGTRVYQGMAWRFHPDDFRMATRYGRPAGSSLADWPVTYAELEPFYTMVENELGVAGDGSAHREQGPRSKDYPMPPFPPTREAGVLKAGADRLGWVTGPVPLLINTVPRDGGGACVRCGECVGFSCPVGAKNGTHNKSLVAAVATGSCTIGTGIRAVRVLIDAKGRATGVRVADEVSGARREIEARTVVVSAGAIETARLLLNSGTDEHPTGLGNGSGHVGRHLQGHVYVGAYGLFDDIVQDMNGPGVSIATADFLHGLDGDATGGGVLANEVIKTPIGFHKSALHPDAPRWGARGGAAMRQAYLRTSHVQGPVQEFPSPDSRVRVSPDVRDALGVPVAMLSGSVHPETVRAAAALAARARAWMDASRAKEVWSPGISTGLSAGQHQAGTARMGDDPASSVTDPFGQVHGHPGLWVADASVHVTNGGVNPVLTILALAHRTASEIAGRRMT